MRILSPLAIQQERDLAPVGMEVRGENRRTVQWKGEGRATVGHRGRRVINSDVGGIEVWRIQARRWRKRPDQAVALPTVGGTSVFASVVPVLRNALTPFSSPVTARVTDSNLR